MIWVRGCVFERGYSRNHRVKLGGVEVRAHQLRILIMGVPPSLCSPLFPLTVSMVIGVVGSVNDYSSVDVAVAIIHSNRLQIESGMEMD